MKHLLWLSALFFALLPAAAQAQTAAESLAKVQELIKQGNHREAADLGKAALAKADATGEMLEVTIQALTQLQTSNEQEQLLEDTVKTHPQDAAILLSAAKCFQGLPHQGFVIDNKFERGQWRGQGRHVQTVLKDRVRSLQLLEAALKSRPDDTRDMMRYHILRQLRQVLSTGSYGMQHPSQVWSLQQLSDLTQIPLYDEQSGLDGPTSGIPVDADGNPIFFQTPVSWQAATTDAQRFCWVMEQMTRTEGPMRHEALRFKADLAKAWFSVQTIAGYGFRFDTSDENSARQDGIATLQTLKDDETVAKLATGPKRFKLPAEWAFLPLLRSLAEDVEVQDAGRFLAWISIADELRDRRRYPDAAEALKQAITQTQDGDTKKHAQAQLDQITGNWGRFEPQATMPAGKEAKLQLVFRNAKKISLSARKVDVTKLLADTEAYLRSEPQEQERQQTNVAAVGQRLLEKDGDKYLGKPVAEWSQDLEPRANHWDKRVVVPTPLKDAGAYLVEAKFGAPPSGGSLKVTEPASRAPMP